ncbi:MAG: helix-turn-helix transcriptional regulator [Firmicutes bacterium]|nr:helix-turn-helix transcriptional regulator [Bacillota bacterium]
MKMVTRLREYRAKKGMTQDALASAVGVRRETIVHLENGRYNPSLKLAFTIAKSLGASIEELFDFVEG